MSSDAESAECDTEDEKSPLVREDAEKVVDEALSDIYPNSMGAGGSLFFLVLEE
jgi:hypothetical protein